MAQARYFRLVGIETAGHADLELSEIALYSGSERVDALAGVSSSHSPQSGSLAALSDANTATICRFNAVHVRASGFFLQWDFGATRLVSAIDFAATSSSDGFPVAAIVIASLDGVAWFFAGAVNGAAFPGSGGWSGYAPWIALNSDDITGPGVLSADRLTFTSSLVFDGYQGVRSIWGVSAGKWYWEAQISALPATSNCGMGIATSSAALGGTRLIFIGANPQGAGYFNNDGRLYYKNVASGSGVVATYSVGDIVGVALDCDSRTVTFYKNGTQVWALSGIPDGVLFPAMSTIWGCSAKLNLGAAAFIRPIPSGYNRFTDSSMSVPIESSVRRNLGFVVAAIAHDAETPALSMRKGDALMAVDVEFGGRGKIWGANEIEVAANQRVPVGGRVVLLRQRDKILVRETWANPATGAWEFSGVDAAVEYLVLAEDLAGNYRPVAANRLVPEVAL